MLILFFSSFFLAPGEVITVDAANKTAVVFFDNETLVQNRTVAINNTFPLTKKLTVKFFRPDECKEVVVVNADHIISGGITGDGLCVVSQIDSLAYFVRGVHNSSTGHFNNESLTNKFEFWTIKPFVIRLDGHSSMNLTYRVGRSNIESHECSFDTLMGKDTVSILDIACTESSRSLGRFVKYVVVIVLLAVFGLSFS